MERLCGSCNATFTIRNADLNLLERLSPVIQGERFSIPPPTLCPDCRLQRRLSFFNDRALYKRKSDLSGKVILSTFHADSHYPAVSSDEWWSDDWDPLEYGQDFDFHRSFFEQFDQLRRKVPRNALFRNSNCVGSEYVNNTGDVKNCYLLFGSYKCEDCYYGYRVINCRDCVDCLVALDCEGCYECVNAFSCYDCSFSQNISNCSESSFLFDCQNCDHCLFSMNLRNSSYCIFNQQCTKEEYAQRKSQIEFGKYSAFCSARSKFIEFKKEQPHRHAILKQTENTFGSNAQETKDCYMVFSGKQLENVAYTLFVQEAKDCLDIDISVDNVELLYEVMGSGVGASRLLFCDRVAFSASDILYSDNCLHNVHNLFGCVGLRQKQNCILNKQYTPEEYSGKVQKIIQHMQKTNEWGEFFPMHLSPYGYNETMANEYFPLSKDEALAVGANWKDEAPLADPTRNDIGAEHLADDITEVEDHVCDNPIRGEVCGKPFKVQGQELAFYKKKGYPLPRRHPDQRHLDRIELMTPPKLWERKCKNCEAALLTPYHPSRPENIVCEACYLRDVY